MYDDVFVFLQCKIQLSRTQPFSRSKPNCIIIANVYQMIKSSSLIAYTIHPMCASSVKLSAQLKPMIWKVMALCRGKKDRFEFHNARQTPAVPRPPAIEGCSDVRYDPVPIKFVMHLQL